MICIRIVLNFTERKNKHFCYITGWDGGQFRDLLNGHCREGLYFTEVCVFIYKYIYIYIYTGLFEMIVAIMGLYLQMQHHVISFYGVTSRIRFIFLLFPQASQN